MPAQALLFSLPPFLFVCSHQVLLSYQGIQHKRQGLSPYVKQPSMLETSEVYILYFSELKELRPIKSELLREMNILHARFQLNVTAIA